MIDHYLHDNIHHVSEVRFQFRERAFQFVGMSLTDNQIIEPFDQTMKRAGRKVVLRFDLCPMQVITRGCYGDGHTTIHSATGKDYEVS